MLTKSLLVQSRVYFSRFIPTHLCQIANDSKSDFGAQLCKLISDQHSNMPTSQRCLTSCNWNEAWLKCQTELKVMMSSSSYLSGLDSSHFCGVLEQ